MNVVTHIQLACKLSCSLKIQQVKTRKDFLLLEKWELKKPQHFIFRILWDTWGILQEILCFGQLAEFFTFLMAD